MSLRSWLSCESRIGNGSVDFCGGRKAGEPGENPWNRTRTKSEPESNHDHIREGDWRSHPCAMPALLKAC